jgi:hypothetical protein
MMRPRSLLLRDRELPDPGDAAGRTCQVANVSAFPSSLGLFIFSCFNFSSSVFSRYLTLLCTVHSFPQDEESKQNKHIEHLVSTLLNFHDFDPFLLLPFRSRSEST